MSSTMTLSPDIMTIQQIEAMVHQLEVHVRRLRIGGSKTGGLDGAPLRFMEQNNLKSEQAVDVEAALAALKGLARVQPTIIMKSAQTLNEELLRQISMWFRNLIGPNLLLSIRVDHSLLAGITLQTPENFYDFSLSSGLLQGREYLHKVITKA